MIIGGMQKLSLIDYPGKLSCIIFTRSCSFRCHYCHNPELVLPELFQGPISENFVIEFLESRKGKLDGVVITGGEPTIQNDLLEFMSKIKNMGYSVKLDSSGICPELLENAIKLKLVDYIAMDIKAPLKKYSLVAGVNIDTEKIKRSIEIIKNSGVDYEFRTTIVESQLSFDDIMEIAKLISGSKKYILQKFRSGNTLDNSFANESTYTDDQFESIRNKVSEYVSCSVR